LRGVGGVVRVVSILARGESAAAQL